MHYFHNYISILLLILPTRVIYTASVGQFFQITKNDLPENTRQPLLSNDAFECSRQNSCTTVVRTTFSSGPTSDSSKVVFTMSKTKGMLTKQSITS